MRCFLPVYQCHAVCVCPVQIWNESPFDARYVKVLRSALNAAGLSSVRLVVADGDWSPADYVATDPDFAASVYALGSPSPHLPNLPLPHTCYYMLLAGRCVYIFY